MTTQPEKPVAKDAWNTIADRYASMIDRKAHNAFYDKPANFSLLPDISGKKVLDAGCGPGAYAEKLLELGAEVTCIDSSTKMLEYARRRAGDRANIIEGDLTGGLGFLEDESFDVVLSALALSCVRNWDPVFQAFFRVLKSGGEMIMSCQHPFADYLYEPKENYFEIDLYDFWWKGFGGEPVRVPTYRRPLNDVFNPITNAGFLIDKVLEPTPVEECRNANEDDYEWLVRNPCFLSIRGIKPCE